MERSRRNNIILKIICITVLTFYAMYFVGIPLIKSMVRKLELSRMPYYVFYDSYDTTDECYEIYLMLNGADCLPEADVIKNAVTDSLIVKMREVPKVNPLYGNLYETYGDRVMHVYLMLPTEELSYGLEKPYTHIETNYILGGPVVRAVRAKLVIPIGAASSNKCKLTFNPFNAY